MLPLGNKPLLEYLVEWLIKSKRINEIIICVSYLHRSIEEPTVTGFAGGRPRVQDVVAYWPALIDRNEIEPHLRVEVTTA
jgi:NDP-sugar pyrophosphorylase family protein